jgi:hypothetical protein
MNEKWTGRDLEGSGFRLAETKFQNILGQTEESQQNPQSANRYPDREVNLASSDYKSGTLSLYQATRFRTVQVASKG